MADVCLLLLEDGSGLLLLEDGAPPTLRLENNTGDLVLEDGSGVLLLEVASLLLEAGAGDLELEGGGWGSSPWGSSAFGDYPGTLLLEENSRLVLEACPQPAAGIPVGGWAEPATVRENETDLVVAVIHSLRRRRRLTVG